MLTFLCKTLNRVGLWRDMFSLVSSSSSLFYSYFTLEASRIILNTRALHFRQLFLFIGWYNLIMLHSNKTVTVTTLRFRTHATLEKGQDNQLIPRSGCKMTIANSEDPDQGLRCLLHSSYKQFLIQRSGNTTITNCRQPHGTARKSHSTITRHQDDKLSKATSSLFPIKMIAILEWT